MEYTNRGFRGDRLRSLREAKHFTQAQLGKILYVSPVTISNYETGKAQPSADIIIMLADYFEKTSDYFLTGKVQSIPLLKEIEFKFSDEEREALAMNSKRYARVVGFIADQIKLSKIERGKENE